MGDSCDDMLRSLALLSVIAIGAHASSETVTLSNGVVMPTLAFGANVWDPATCKQATAECDQARHADAGLPFIGGVRRDHWPMEGLQRAVHCWQSEDDCGEQLRRRPT